MGAYSSCLKNTTYVQPTESFGAIHELSVQITDINIV